MKKLRERGTNPEIGLAGSSADIYGGLRRWGLTGGVGNWLLYSSTFSGSLEKGQGTVKSCEERHGESDLRSGKTLRRRQRFLGCSDDRPARFY